MLAAFSFEDDDGLCCYVLWHSLVPTMFHGKELMGEGEESNDFLPETSSGHFSYRELSL